MPLCAAGHDSATTDYCDVCGLPLDESTPTPTGPPPDPCPACDTPRTGRFCESCGHDFTAPAPSHPATRPAPTAAQGRPEPATRSSPTNPPAPTAAPGGPDPATPSAAATPSGPLATSGPAATSGRLATSGPAATSGPVAIPEGWSVTVIVDADYHRAVLAAEGPDAAAIVLPEHAPDRRITLIGTQQRIGRRSLSRRVYPEIDLAGPPEDPGVSHLHAVLLARPDGTWSVLDPGSTNGTTINGGPDPIATGVAVPLADGDRIHVGAWTTITLHAP